MRILVDGMLRSAITRMFPYWEKWGHKIVDENPDVQLSSIKIRQDHRVPTVLRLDGIIYDAAVDWKAENTNIERSYKRANAVIFQSETCMQFAHKYFGRQHSSYDEYIIHNGVDREKWYSPIEHDDQIRIVSCANWRRWKRLPEMIEVFQHFKENYKKSTLYIIGEMRRGAKEILSPDVVYMGKMSPYEIRKFYQVCDLYLHLAKNDSCPSSVVEAIGAGIPVITTNACGGATEMSMLAGGYVANGDYQSFEPHFLYKDDWNAITAETRNEMAYLMNEALWFEPPDFPQSLHIEYVAEKYIKVMESVL